MITLTYLSGKMASIDAVRFYLEDDFIVFANKSDERVFAAAKTQVFTVELSN